MKKAVQILAAAGIVGVLALSACGKESGSTSESSKSGWNKEVSESASSASNASGGATETEGYALPSKLVYRVGFIDFDNAAPNTYLAAMNFKDYVESEEFAAEIGVDQVEVMVADSAMDIEKQSTNVETLLTKGVDMMFIIGVDTEGNTAAVEACNAEGIPVFMVGTEATGGSWRFIGFDETELGKTQGQWCVDNLPENAKIFYLEGTPGREASTKRKQGFEEAISAREDLEIVSSQNGDFDAATSMQVTEDWITAYGDEIDCIVGSDDKSAAGAVEALNQNQMLDDVAVVGVVHLPENAEAIQEGSWRAAVLCYWPSIGTLSGEICKAIYMGQDIEDRTNIQLYALDSSNLEELSKEVFGE